MLGQFPACFSSTVLLALLLWPGITPSYAQSEATAIPSAERTLLVSSFANEKLSGWQKRLNLTDWDISVLVVRSTDLKPNTVGNIRWDREKKSAVIRVLDPADYKMKTEAMLRDIEFTVVHELIHLEISPVLSDLKRTDANRMEEEYAVNHMAEALLKLHRGGE